MDYKVWDWRRRNKFVNDFFISPLYVSVIRQSPLEDGRITEKCSRSEINRTIEKFVATT
jgi:hypothetical protein